MKKISQVLFSGDSAETATALRGSLTALGSPFLASRVAVDKMSSAILITDIRYAFDGVSIAKEACSCCSAPGRPVVAINGWSAYSRGVKHNIADREKELRE